MLRAIAGFELKYQVRSPLFAILFIIVFALLALIGGGARIKYAYDEAMERHERERAEAMRATGNQPGGPR